MIRGRVLEYTDDDLRERFAPEGHLDIAAITALPTIFMSEGIDDELARVGSITNLRLVNGDFEVSYLLDPQIPPISNATLMDMSVELGIANFEFSRTHWAVKSANLYETLYRRQLANPLKPKVFRLPDAPVEQDLISVMMPFAPQFDGLYAELVACCQAVGLRCQRADDIWLNDAVIEDVVHLIATSRVVIADLTGKNANVFYETGIAHSLGKDVVLITQSHDDVPFDLRHLRYIPYLNNGEGHRDLSEQLQRRLAALRVA